MKEMFDLLICQTYYRNYLSNVYDQFLEDLGNFDENVAIKGMP